MHINPIRKYFNPLPRKEGDRMGLSPRDGLDISIHSLVKRETEKEPNRFQRLAISIHSLVKRETGFRHIEQRAKDDFNPLPRKEGDCERRKTVLFTQHFNPLPRKEGDVRTGTDGSKLLEFQSTPS